MNDSRRSAGDQREDRRRRAEGSHFHIEYMPGDVPEWSIESTSGGRYRVLLPSFPARDGAQCNCPDFTRRGLGSCKHVEAALAYASLNPPKTESAAPDFSVDWERLGAEASALAERVVEKNLKAEDAAREMRKLGRVLTE